MRDAAATWRSVDAVYELAITRLLIAQACRRLGDDDTTDLEVAAARRTLADLGAGPALAALSPRTPPPVPRPAGSPASRD